MPGFFQAAGHRSGSPISPKSSLTLFLISSCFFFCWFSLSFIFSAIFFFSATLGSANRAQHQCCLKAENFKEKGTPRSQAGGRRRSVWTSIHASRVGSGLPKTPKRQAHNRGFLHILQSPLLLTWFHLHLLFFLLLIIPVILEKEEHHQKWHPLSVFERQPVSAGQFHSMAVVTFALGTLAPPRPTEGTS